MSDLVLRCQRRADMENDTTISKPEWKALISEQYGHLYSTVVKAGMRYFETTDVITATGATSYALPSDHDETIGIDRILDSLGNKTSLDELMVQERNMWAGSTGDAMAYSVVAQTIILFPRPTTGTYNHVYIAQSPDVSALSDEATVDVVTADGEAFLIWGVTVKSKSKRDQDPSLAIAERNAAEGRFMEDCTLRAFVNPRRRVVRPSPAYTYDDDDGLGNDPANWRFR